MEVLDIVGKLLKIILPDKIENRKAEGGNTVMVPSLNHQKIIKVLEKNGFNMTVPFNKVGRNEPCSCDQYAFLRF